MAPDEWLFAFIGYNLGLFFFSSEEADFAIDLSEAKILLEFAGSLLFAFLLIFFILPFRLIALMQ